MREAANEITSAFALLGRQTLRLHKWPDATGKFLHLCVTGFDLASIREKPSNHDRYAAATTSYVKQNIGHHEGTPGSSISRPWNQSNTPCAASAATTHQRVNLNPMSDITKNATMPGVAPRVETDFSSG